MKDYWQCMECGEVSCLEHNYNLDDDEICAILYCNGCETETKQLWCGNSIEDFYELYDPVKDPRYYEY